MTITAVKTQGYLSSYVKTFKLRYSLDGGVSNFYQDEFGDKVGRHKSCFYQQAFVVCSSFWLVFFGDLFA